MRVGDVYKDSNISSTYIYIYGITTAAVTLSIVCQVHLEGGIKNVSIERPTKAASAIWQAASRDWAE